MTSPRALAALVGLVLAGCHVTTTSIEDQQAPPSLRPHLATAEPRGELIELTAAGSLRLAEQLFCHSDLVAETTRHEVISRDPNLATTIVGIIAGSVGLVSLVIGLSSEDAGGAPATWLGLAGVGGGVPLIVGPLRGTGTERTLVSTSDRVVGQRRAPCGTRAIGDATAELRIDGVDVAGAVDAEGVFSVSPFRIVDAYRLEQVPTLAIAAKVSRGGELVHTFEHAISAEDLARTRDGFLAAAGIDSRVEPLGKVPGLRAGAIEVVLSEIDGRPAAEVKLRIANDGPGHAYRVRGVLSATSRDLDGRVFYVGYLPAGAVTEPRLVIPLTRADLVPAHARLAIDLRDAHDTAARAPLQLKTVR